MEMRLNLWIDEETNEVVFAEVGKDFIDFLFSLFSLPLGTFLSLVNDPTMFGSITNLQQRLDDLNTIYMINPLKKESLLRPPIPIFVQGVPLMFPGTSGLEVYWCGKPHAFMSVSDDKTSLCHTCKSSMSKETFCAYADQPGYVQRTASYIFMDDLSVEVLSSVAGVSQIAKNKDLSTLTQKTVQFGSDEALKLLNVSLNSKKVLTDVFLTKKDNKCAESVVAVKTEV